MASSAPTIVFGTASIANWSPEVQQGILSTLEKHHVTELDTAYVYNRSEEVLGQLGAPEKFIISSKAPGFVLGGMSKQKVLDGMEKTLKDLGVSSIDIYYLHCPDPKTPIEETLSAIQEIYAAGKFKRFGLSNFLASDVQKIYDIQAAAKSVLPTVFQGNYNAVARHTETSLFPLLRKLHISFYAYSPIAGGFLVKSSTQLRTRSVDGRFGPNSTSGAMYPSMYGKESLYSALDEWGKIAENAGISKAALAYRWVAFHSILKREYGDAVIVGASKVEQLEESLEAIERGPLDEWIAERASAIWGKVEEDAPLDNWNSFAALE